MYLLALNLPIIGQVCIYPVVYGTILFLLPTCLFLRDLLKWIGKKDALVFDAYAGSGATAESILVQNACDNGARSFILCQTPELVDPKSAEAKAGFKTIDKITTKRIKNIIKRYPGVGFQIFK